MRLPHPAVDRGDLKVRGKPSSKLFLGFVILEGSTDFLQRKRAVDNGLQTITGFKPLTSAFLSILRAPPPRAYPRRGGILYTSLSLLQCTPLYPSNRVDASYYNIHTGWYDRCNVSTQ